MSLKHKSASVIQITCISQCYYDLRDEKLMYFRNGYRFKQSSGSESRKSRLTAVGIRRADHATPSIRKSSHQLRQHAAVAQSV
jgi:hypothetical protein